MPLDRGVRLGPYEIIEPLGAGGMGEVYRARDPRLGRDLAIKVLTPSLAQDAEALGRFEREARTASSLNHPNIVHIYEIGEAVTASGPVHYIAMEYIEGQTLRARLKALLGWAEAGKIRPHVSHRLPLEDYAQAMRLLVDRTAIGRVALMMR